MSFQSSVSYTNPPQNFVIRSPNVVVKANREAPAVTAHNSVQSLGNAAAAIPPSALVCDTIVVSPTGTNSVTYTLPTAAAILSSFGEELGVSKLAAGDLLKLRVVNRGITPAYISSAITGGDGTIVIALPAGTGSTSPLYTGTVAAIGHSTSLTLEWLTVSSGANGSTGTFSIYC